MPKQKIILLYIPVLHQGYWQFLQKNSAADALFILGPEIIANFDHLQRKDLRALNPSQILSALQSWNLPLNIQIANYKELKKINNSQTTIITTQEDEIQKIIENNLQQCLIKHDSYFLRWDKTKSQKKQKISTEHTISNQDWHKKMMSLAQKEAQKSADWWRQVGALIFKNNQILLIGHNHHLPHPQQPYLDGDPRANFHKGEKIEISTALHAEAGLIAQAAKEGIALDNAEIFVTTFPCSNCAKLIAQAGVKTLYYQEGYSMLDGERVLHNNNVKIIRVKNN